MSSLFAVSRQAIPPRGTRTEYILDIDGNASATQLVVSASDRQLRVYDSSTLALCSTCHGHKDAITSLMTSKQCNSVFYTSSADKCVAMWDTRASETPIGRLRLPDEVSSVAVNGRDTLLAAACGEDITFFDVRKLAITAGAPKLGSYTDLHSNIVTNLAFSPHSERYLASGAEDGLICVCDTSTGEAEEAVVSVLNVDCAVRRMGFFGPDFEGLFCLSTVEDASFWHFPSAQRIVQFANVREDYGVDYLVGCHYHEDALSLVAGRYDGSALLFRVEPTGCCVASRMDEGHTDVVRCSYYEAGRGILYTGAEDGHLVAWAPSREAPHDSSRMDLDSECTDRPRGADESDEASVEDSRLDQDVDGESAGIAKRNRAHPSEGKATGGNRPKRRKQHHMGKSASH